MKASLMGGLFYWKRRGERSTSFACVPFRHYNFLLFQYCGPLWGPCIF